MSKLYDVVNPNGELIKATYKELKEKGYTILLTSLKELEEDEDFNLDENVMLSISFQNKEDDESEDETFFYNDEPVLPEDPAEGEEGFDDKFNYD